MIQQPLINQAITVLVLAVAELDPQRLLRNNVDVALTAGVAQKLINLPVAVVIDVVADLLRQFAERAAVRSKVDRAVTVVVQPVADLGCSSC